MSVEDRKVLDHYLECAGIEAYTTFWKGCVDALLVHAKRSELIAWPPSFAIQDRDPEYVRLLFESTKTATKKK